MNTSKNVDAYIVKAPRDAAQRLIAIRKLIKKLAPHAEEKMAYGMPGYMLNGPLVYFGLHKNHIGFYPIPTTITVFKKELAGYKTSKGSIQFPLDQKLPLPLISKIIKYRIQEKKAKK